MRASSFPDRLKRAIGSRSYAEVADEAGCSVATITRLITGSRRRPYRHTLIKLASATGVSPLWLEDGTGPMLAAQGKSPNQLAPRDCRRCEHHIDAANYGEGKAHNLCGHPNVRTQGHAIASAPIIRGVDTLCARGRWFTLHPSLIPNSLLETRRRGASRKEGR
jgi:transcriptional regulator with XRE-family HTH domain